MIGSKALGLGCVLVMALGACSSTPSGSGSGALEPSSTTGNPPTSATADTEAPPTSADAFSLDDVPEAARVAIGSADPRGSAYWVMWSTCGEGSQADVAAANGGTDAGWILLDDLLTDPGVALGEYRIPACEAGVNLLEGSSVEGASTDDPAYSLAAGLLTAELNLSVGAETCPAVEEAVVAGHVILASLGFDGEGRYLAEPGVAASAGSVIELLGAYNAGELCR